MKTALVIGGGFAGCAAAHQLALMGGWRVTLVEIQPFLGAGVRTQWHGGHPYTFGPRHFLTQDEKLFAFLDSYVPLRRCSGHEFLTYIEQDQAFYNFPIHRDDIPKMPDKDRIEAELGRVTLKGVAAAKNLEEYWISSVGQTLYGKFVEKYSKKMWLIDNNRQIEDFSWSPKGVAIKNGPRAAWDTALSAYPIAPNGYDDYFDISTADADVRLSTAIEQFDIPAKTVVIDGEKFTFDIIVNTAPPDVLFEQCYGELPFVGRDFHKIVLPVEHCFPENVYFLYYAGDEQFTRIVEYKKFTQHQAPTTLLGLEIPSMNGKHYPLPLKSEQAKAQKYLDLMPDGVFSIGRPGSYRYDIDIDDTIAQAMEVAELLRA
jgi:UDP-galactopyranose mutase